MAGFIKSERKLLRKTIKTVCTEIGKKHHWFMEFYRSAMYTYGNTKYKRYYKKYPVDDKIVLFQVFWGKKYCCSPKAIYEKMLRDERFNDYTFVWVFKKPKQFAYLENNKNTVVVRWGSREAMEYYSRAKFWIANTRVKEEYDKKPEQIYIQCWHGTPLKKLGYDIEVKGNNATNTNEDICKKYSQDAARYTYMVSPSEFTTEKLASAFGLPDSSIVQTIGYPRNDFLINYTDEDVDAIYTKLSIDCMSKTGEYKDINKLKKHFGIDRDKKVILYAPTWREDQHVSGQGYTYDLNIDFSRLQQEFGKDYIILFRAHYFISNLIDLSEYRGFVYDVSNYDDINELYVISDILITDYSSVFFDYSNLHRPMLFYMYDYEKYKNEMHDFYFDLSELPGPIVETEDDLIKEIKSLDTYWDKYTEPYKAFNDKFTYLDDGKATERLIDICIANK